MKKKKKKKKNTGAKKIGLNWSSSDEINVGQRVKDWAKSLINGQNTAEAFKAAQKRRRKK